MRNIEYINLDQDLAVEELPNGFISLLANLTRTGIFTYQQIDPDGTVRILKQLRLPEEVFSEETMASLSGLPITNNHPNELINPENASDFIVGMASDTAKKIRLPVQGDSEEFVQQRLTFFDEDTIDQIRNRTKTQMSLGYSCELEFEPGTYKGQQYDAIQRNIRINHGSLVSRARGGESCRVLLDSGEEKEIAFLRGEDKKVVNFDGFSIDVNNKKERDVKIKFGGKEYDEAGVLALLDSFEKKIEEVKGLSDGKQAEVDKLTAVCDDLKSKIKVQNDADDAAEFRKAVKERVALETRGLEVLGSEVNMDSLSDAEIKVKVIEKLRPATNLDGKSEAYIDARFDVCVEDHAKTSERKIGSNIQNNDSSDDPEAAANKAKAKAWDRARNAWKSDKEAK